ncbi:hypothetical protein Tco_0088743 [Tanacetum coccineum]
MAGQSVSTATTPYVSAASTPTCANAGESSFVYLGGKIPIDASTLPNVDLPIDPNMLDLEDYSDALSNDGIFNGAYDDENVGAVADFNNMDDSINNRTNHKDHQNCLLACFLSQEEPKNISQALQDESWVEAMQEELLQFKLQKVWILVDLPSGKKGRRLISWQSRSRLLWANSTTEARIIASLLTVVASFIKTIRNQPTPSPTHPSEDQSEPQPDPFLRPSSSNPIPDSIPEGSGGNHGGQSSSDRSLSGNEDGLTLQSVYDLCVSLCKQVTTQAAQIKDLKAQIKQLKKKAKPVISHHNAWIKSVSMKKRLARKKSLKTKLMQKESVSKQGRKPAKSEPTVHKDPAFDDLDDAMDYMETEDAHDEGTVKDSEETRVSTEDQVSTDKPKVSTDKLKVSTDKLKVSTDKPNEGTAEPNKGTAEPKDGNSDESAAPTTIFRDDETIAQFLVTMSQNKTKQKGFEIKEIKDTDRPRNTTERSILTLNPLPKIDPKDKGKKVLKKKAESDAESKGVNEAEKKFKMLANDEEIARKVQEEWEAEEEKKKLAEEEATMAAFTNEYDYIQARLNADKILAEKLQEEEREKFTIEQRAKFLHDTIAAQRRFLAQQRSEAIRNKLPTRNQLRNQMMTYLKYVGGYKHAQLNKKKFEEIQVMYEKVKRANENFIPIGSAKDEKLIEKMNKKAAGMDKEEVSEEPESTKVKVKIKEPKENIRKRSGRRLKMKAPKRSKRQKTDFDHEEENHLRTFLKIVPEEEEKIDYEVLGTRYPIINWESKFYDYGHFGRELIYYRVFRADGSSRWIKTFSEMIKFFDRMDLGDLRIMFESKEDDELWKNQEEWKLQSWIFYENCGVHVLRLEDSTEINMLVKTSYPLTKNTVERMMDLRLTAVSDDDTIFDFLRFIEQQIDEFGGQDGSEKDL